MKRVCLMVLALSVATLAACETEDGEAPVREIEGEPAELEREPGFTDTMPGNPQES